MANSFTTVTTEGYGKRILNSISGILIGFILFLASFGVLYWNEGRVDLSAIAKTAPVVSADKAADPSLNGQLVALNGVLSSDKTLGDDVVIGSDHIILKDDKYIAVQRTVEMYSWVENKSTQTQNNTGGSSTTSTTYTYQQQWTQSPANSTTFAHPDGHQNPSLQVQSATNKVADAKVGTYSLDMTNVDLPSFTSILLSTDKITLPSSASLQQGYVYVGKSYQTPAIGDLRVSYSVVNAGANVTVFGKLNGTSLDPYYDNKNNKLYSIFVGTKDEAVAAMKTEYTTMTWIFRGAGFLMMWIGLTLILAPITVVLDFLPLLGGLTGGLIGVATFLVALVLSGVTILVSKVFHSVTALLITVAVIVVASIIFVSTSKKKKAAMNQPPQQ